MPNKPPVCIMTIDKDELTWPDNQIILDLSQSYDQDKRGEIVKYEFSCSDPDVKIETNVQVAKVTLPKKPTSFSFVGKVTDRGGLSSEMTRTAKMKVKTSFGASGPTIDLNVLKDLAGFPSITRYQVILSMYRTGSPSRRTEEAIKLGVPVFLNCNFDNVEKDPATGEKIPNPFITDKNLYLSKLNPVLEYFKDSDLVIPVCENEPTNKNYHKGPMSNYLHQLEWFVEACQKYGYKKFTDGGLHVDTILGADLDDTTGEGSAVDAQELLRGYASINLWKVNFHTSNTKSTYDGSRIGQAVNKVLISTGHDCVSNEWHVQSKPGKYVGTVDTLKSMMKGYKDSGVEFSVYISGTSDQNEVLNVGDFLTDMGKAYQAFVNAS